MNCGRCSTITRRRGTSLLEVSVACTLFLGVTSLLLTLLIQNQRASTKIVNHSDTTASLMVVFERVRLEMRQSRVVGVDPQGRLMFWRVRTVNNIPQLTPEGTPDWLPGTPADPSVATLYGQNGTLRRDFQGTTQVLAHLGKDGSIAFNWNQADHTLTIAGGVGQRDPQHPSLNNYEPFTYNLCLSNRE